MCIRDRSLPIPHFLNVQRDAFQRLIEQKADAGSGRGLAQVFRDIFPLDDSQGRFRLEFKGCRVGEAKYTVDECIDRDMTYAAPLLATLQLVRRERGPGGNKRVVDIKEKEVYLGDPPHPNTCLLYTSPSPRDRTRSRMPSSA